MSADYLARLPTMDARPTLAEFVFPVEPGSPFYVHAPHEGEHRNLSRDRVSTAEEPQYLGVAPPARVGSPVHPPPGPGYRTSGAP